MSLWGWRRRGTVLACALLGVVFSPNSAVTKIASPDGCVQPTRRMTMYAVQLPDDGEKTRLAYGLTPETASIPGPTIEMLEGECLAITVVNDIPVDTLQTLRDDPLEGSQDPAMPLAVSLHVHGVKYTQASDGTIDTNSYVLPGRSRTYTWYAAPRATIGGRIVSLGTAGYWWYHDHVVGTSHGTLGVASGLFGALIVRRPGDLVPSKTFVVGMGPNATLNLRHHPETDCELGKPMVPSNSCYVATMGERVEFVVVGFGNDFHTFHLHGHTWANNRTGMFTSQADDTALIDNKTVGPADSFGFQIIAGEEVGAGQWMLHCHVQSHSDKGMSTFFHVLRPDGSPAPNASGPINLFEHKHYGRP